MLQYDQELDAVTYVHVCTSTCAGTYAVGQGFNYMEVLQTDGIYNTVNGNKLLFNKPPLNIFPRIIHVFDLTLFKTEITNLQYGVYEWICKIMLYFVMVLSFVDFQCYAVSMPSLSCFYTSSSEDSKS